MKLFDRKRKKSGLQSMIINLLMVELIENLLYVAFKNFILRINK